MINKHFKFSNEDFNRLYLYSALVLKKGKGGLKWFKLIKHPFTENIGRRRLTDVSLHMQQK